MPNSHSACFAPLAFVKACIAHDRGERERAAFGLDEAWRYCLDGGAHIGVMLVGLVSANIAISAGRHEFAWTLLQHLRSEIAGPVSGQYLSAILLNDAWRAFRNQDCVGSDALLREALCLAAADMRARERLSWYPNALSEMLPEAMARNIEPATARLLARHFNVRPARVDIESWPFRVRIRTLGGFEVRVADSPLAFGRKLPKLTIALLKVLIAFGGRDVPEERIIDALWPDEEADAAHECYTAALHRMRKLLGGNERLPQCGGALSLERSLVWVDSLALEDLGSGAGHAARIVDLYAGSFLPADTEPCFVPTRERLRAKFNHAVAQFFCQPDGEIMKTRNAFAIIAAACLIVLGANAGAQTLPKTGTIQFHTGWKWTGEHLNVAEKHDMGHGTAIGSTFNDKGSGPLHQGPATCFGTYHFIDGHGKNKGFCAFGDPDGDRIFTDYTGTDGAQGTNEIVGGTGKYQGIQGSGPWKCQGSGANGELQCVQRLDYRLP